MATLFDPLTMGALALLARGRATPEGVPNEADAATFYTSGEHGYLHYPVHSRGKAA